MAIEQQTEPMPCFHCRSNDAILKRTEGTLRVWGACAPCRLRRDEYLERRRWEWVDSFTASEIGGDVTRRRTARR